MRWEKAVLDLIHLTEINVELIIYTESVAKLVSIKIIRSTRQTHYLIEILGNVYTLFFSAIYRCPLETHCLCDSGSLRD